MILNLAEAYGLYRQVVRYLEDWDLRNIARLTNNTNFSATALSARLNDLGVTEPAGESKPAVGWARGASVVLDDGSGDGWIRIPIVQHGRETGVGLDFRLHDSGNVNSHTITLEAVDGIMSMPSHPRELPRHQLDAWFDKIAEAEKGLDIAVAARFEMMQSESSAPLPGPERELAQAILDAIVERRYDDLWLIGGQRGLMPHEIEEAISEVDGAIVRPPRGLPPDTLLSYDANLSGFVIEFPLWTARAVTRFVVAVHGTRDERGVVSGFVYDIIQAW